MKIDYTRYYLKWHSDTEEHRQRMLAFYRRILLPHTPTDRSARGIDIGCGMGSAVEALQSDGYRNITGVEYDEGQVAACCKKGLDVVLSKDTAKYLQQLPGSFDFAVCLDVIEHIPTGEGQLEFVAAIAGALKVGGFLICSVPNANSALAPRWRYNDWTHTSSFTEHSLDFLLFNAGFSDVKVHGYELGLKPANCWLPIGGVRHWWAFRFFRMIRRAQMMAELGPEQGRSVPLSLNLMGVAKRTE
jgi:SAM-dependent methyltransferase